MSSYSNVSLTVALGRIALAMFVLIGGLVILDIFVYLGAMGHVYSIKVADAYNDSYYEGYHQTYNASYREAYSKAYDKGYNKGYEISLVSEPNKQVSSLVEMHNPTYKELREFLASDKTDLNTYISGEYVCFDFAAELNNNAEARGIRAAYVRIRAKEWAHAVVAFETVDRGLIMIEPQSDTEIELVVGKPYPWWLADASSPLSYIEAIEEIQIIW
jgi:hypothetical protein